MKKAKYCFQSAEFIACEFEANPRMVIALAEMATDEDLEEVHFVLFYLLYAERETWLAYEPQVTSHEPEWFRHSREMLEWYERQFDKRAA